MNIIIRGPLGVGKTTVAKMLAAKLDGVYVSIDQILEQLQLDYSPDGNGIPVSHFLRVNDEVVLIAETGKRVVVDGNFYYLKQVQDLIDRLGEVKVFSLTATLQTCIDRDLGRECVHGEDAARAVYGMVTALKMEQVIDTDGQSVQQTVEEILDSLRSKDG